MSRDVLPPHDSPDPRRPLARLAIGPALVVLALMTGLVALALAENGGDPMTLVAQGTRFIRRLPGGTWGYDGQFYYAIALDPRPEQASAFIDVPAYRYQRLLFPLLARAMSLGSPAALPWAFPVLGLLAQTAGTWLVGMLLADAGVNPWVALVYGLWIGFALAVRLDLPETLAFALAAGAMLAYARGRTLASALLFGLALFTKEVTAAFWVAAVLDMAMRKQAGKKIALLALLPGLPYALFQLWLLSVFGRIGLGSGGALATPFLIIPYLGLWGVWFQPAFPLTYKLGLMALFVPGAVLPSLWGLGASLKKLAAGRSHWTTWALLINALAIMPLPYSTFSDLRGMLRFLAGLLLAVMLFCAYHPPYRDGLIKLEQLVAMAMRKVVSGTYCSNSR